MSDKLTPTKVQLQDAEDLLEYQHGYLWSDPGTGKTLTSLVAFEKGGYEVGVVLCPPIAVGMWQSEINTQLGMHAMAIRSGLMQYNEARLQKIDEADWIVMSYSLAAKNRMYVERFLTKGPSVLILDESHYLKTAKAKRTQAVFGKPPRVLRTHRKLPRNYEYADLADKGIGHSASSVWQLTGTPQTRWPDDLYTQLKFGRPEVLDYYGVSSYEQFVRKFCEVRTLVMHGKSIERITGAKNPTMLKNLIRDCHIVRRTREEAWKDMPPITHRDIIIPVQIPMGAFQDLDLDIDDERLIAQLMDPTTPYGQLYRLLGEVKSKSIAEYAVETYDGPVLIGFWHKDAGRMIVQHIKARDKDAKVVYVDGSVSGQERDKIRDRFNAGEINYLVGQMAALNVSTNLQEASRHVIVGEQLPSPGNLEQFYSRVYRKGQNQHVQVDHIHSGHRIDNAIRRIRERKAESVEKTI